MMPTADTVVRDVKAEHRAAEIRGLRELADFLEQHPAVPIPMLDGQNAFVTSRDELAAIARAGSWEKLWLDQWFVLIRQFSGSVTLHVNAERSTVCRKVVTGTKTLPATPEREVETYEWVCDEPSLLAQADAALAKAEGR
jgi:hypothetical protein